MRKRNQNKRKVIGKSVVQSKNVSLNTTPNEILNCTMAENNIYDMNAEEILRLSEGGNIFLN